MAFRSVPRPSSPPGAKASTECPSHTPYQTPVIRRQIKRQTSAIRPQTNARLENIRLNAVIHRLLSTLHNAPDHYHRIKRDDPTGTLTRTKRIPSGQTNHPTPRRTNPLAIQTSAHAPARQQPSRSNAPRGAPEPDSQHKRTSTPGTHPAASTAHAKPPHALGGNQHTPIHKNPPYRTKPHRLTQRATSYSGQRRSHVTAMETIGFEPMTPCLQSRCSTN